MFANRGKVQLSEMIYRLKNQFGEPITWIVVTDPTYDYDTGEMTVQTEEIPIFRAITMPVSYLQRVKYSITFLAANKNFVYDGQHDIANLGLLIDIRDIPFREFDSHHNDRVRLQNGAEFEVNKIEFYEFGMGLIIELKAVTSG